MIINARSPYFISINEVGQIGSKLELFIWVGMGSMPASPTYTFTKPVASSSQIENTYNISSFISEYLNAIKPSDSSTQLWVNVTVKRYKEVSVGVYTLLDTVNNIAVSGYTNYMGGYNQTPSNSEMLVMANPNIELLYLEGTNYDINVYSNLTSGNSISFVYTDLSGGAVFTDTFSTVVRTVLKIPITRPEYTKGNYLLVKYYVSGVLTETKTFLVKPICEPKYTVVACNFINRYGGWQRLNFFKAQTNAITTKGNKYNVAQSSVNYNTSVGKTKVINKNGNKVVTLNTGFVEENYSDLIEDLLLSETILLDGKPVVIKSEALELKSGLNDKNINYQISFEYSFDLINNVI